MRRWPIVRLPPGLCKVFLTDHLYPFVPAESWVKRDNGQNPKLRPFELKSDPLTIKLRIDLSLTGHYLGGGGLVQVGGGSIIFMQGNGGGGWAHKFMHAY